VPETEDGRVVGLRLFIQPQSPYAALGLRNGDRLESINGVSLTDSAVAIAAYGRFTTARYLAVSITRHGRRIILEYNIE
jgi:general secretion pathway protein C